MIHVVTQQDIEQHRPALIAWAEANGLDPNRIDKSGLTIERHGDHQVIAYTEFQVDENGLKIFDPGTNRALRVHRSRPLRHALPDGIGRPLCLCTLGQLDPDCQDHPESSDVTQSDIGS